MTLRTLNYGNYGIVLIMGSAGFISSTVVLAMVLKKFGAGEVDKARKWRSPGGDVLIFPAEDVVIRLRRRE